MKIRYSSGFMILGFLLMTCPGIVSGQGSSNALSWSLNNAYNTYLMRTVHEQYADREVEITKAFSSREAMIAYRDNCIKKYKNIIGGFPEETSLNPKVAGVANYEGFRVEKIIFESIPKRYVTASFYIPDGKGPFPAAIEVCGHGIGGKVPASQAAILFALNKIAVLVVDPIGQGERIQFVNKNSESLTRGSTTEHTLLNQGANLLGTSLAAYEYWDNQRAIDYLMTRPDVDQTHIGVYGSSGGGTQTSYLVGLDDRVTVASVCSYFTERERVLEVYGASDGCQHVPYEGREHLEIADFVLMMAPKPLLIMSGKFDFVDYWGAERAFAELKSAYSALGSPEKVSMFTVEGGHGMPKPKREALVTWFKKWMTGDATPVVEKEQITIQPADLICTSSGQVITSIPGQVSIPDYHLMLADQYESMRNIFVNGGKSQVRKKVSELLGLDLPDVKIKTEQTGIIKQRTCDLIKFQIIRPGQMPVPCIVVFPENAGKNSSVVIYLNEEGKSSFLADENTLLNYVNNNNIVIAADLRGYGETADPLSFNDSKYWNREYRNAMISMHIGKPIMGQRVTDIMSLIDFAETNDQLKGHKITLIANGSYGPVAVHATFLDDRIDRTEITRSVKSFTEYLKDPLQRDVYTNVLYGVLKYYDLQDLVKLAGNNRIRFLD